MSATVSRRQFAASSALAAATGALFPASVSANVSMTPAERSIMGKRFRLAREAAPAWFTLESICQDCRLTPDGLEAIEAGHLEPTARQARDLASEYGVQLSWLLGEKEPSQELGETTDDCRENFDWDIGGQIRQAREAAGLDVDATALALNVPIAYWEEIESGCRTLDFATGVRACILFRAQATDIVRPFDGGRPPLA